MSFVPSNTSAQADTIVVKTKMGLKEKLKMVVTSVFQWNQTSRPKQLLALRDKRLTIMRAKIFPRFSKVKLLNRVESKVEL